MRDLLKQQIMEFISDSLNKITQRSLENEFSEKYSRQKREIRAAIQELVSANELIYTNLFGCSFLEKSFNKPVRISERIVLKPPEIFYQPEADDIVINICHGNAFGAGDHPTTRLALRGIEYLLKTIGVLAATALDMGTGSGVLAIAAVKAGLVRYAIGTEIDPCAIAEAKENVRLNHLEDKIKIYRADSVPSAECQTFSLAQDLSLAKPDNETGSYFSLILANLRYPTLKQLYPQITESLHKGGYAVFSGIKTDEVSDILSLYTKKHFCCKWEKNEKGWAGLVLKK